MGRLKMVRPQLASIGASVRVLSRRTDAERDAASPIRRAYKTRRWRDLRWSVLVRDRFTCRMCGVIEAVTSRLVADHRVPHRGDEALFWDEGNLQCLCKTCHDGRKQAIEANTPRGG